MGAAIGADELEGEVEISAPALASKTARPTAGSGGVLSVGLSLLLASVASVGRLLGSTERAMPFR
jgi:hypothetical protein